MYSFLKNLITYDVRQYTICSSITHLGWEKLKEDEKRNAILTRYVTRRCEDTVEIPDSLARGWEVISEESATVLAIKNSSKTPFVTREWPEIANLHQQEVSRLRGQPCCICHPNRATQVVHLPDALKSRQKWCKLFHIASLRNAQGLHKSASSRVPQFSKLDGSSITDWRGLRAISKHTTGFVSKHLQEGNVRSNKSADIASLRNAQRFHNLPIWFIHGRLERVNCHANTCHRTFLSKHLQEGDVKSDASADIASKGFHKSSTSWFICSKLDRVNCDANTCHRVSFYTSIYKKETQDWPLTTLGFDQVTEVRSICFMSSGLSSSTIWPPVQSTVSTRKSSPSFTSPTGGISGCHLLCRGIVCSHGLFFGSTVTTGRGVLGAIRVCLLKLNVSIGYVRHCKSSQTQVLQVKKKVSLTCTHWMHLLQK